MGRKPIGTKAMSSADRSRQRRRRQRQQQLAKVLTEDAVMLLAFQQYLGTEWPGWPAHEGGLMYSLLWRAFAAGWKADK
jgi:hypothetical protein